MLQTEAGILRRNLSIRGVTCSEFFPVGSRCLSLSAIFSLVALANPNQMSTFLQEVNIIYFHSPLV